MKDGVVTFIEMNTLGLSTSMRVPGLVIKKVLNNSINYSALWKSQQPIYLGSTSIATFPNPKLLVASISISASEGLTIASASP